MIDGFVDTCPQCEGVSELVRLDTDYAYFHCFQMEDGDTYRIPLSGFPSNNIELARDWLHLKATYPQGSWVRVMYGGEIREVEVVGHKASSLKTFEPAVRVYVKGYGTVLFSKQELEAMV